MSSNNTTLWCVAKECMKKDISVKRHFFRFPKEHNRWLEWIRACGRYDLKVMGPEYAYDNYRLCHLHFAKKSYKINKIRPRLHKDAVPTIFYAIKSEWATSSSEDELYETQEESKIESGISIKDEIQTEVNKTNENNIFDCERQIKRKETNSMYSEDSLQKEQLDEQFIKIREKIKVLRKMRQMAKEDIAKYEEEETSCFANTTQTQDSSSTRLYVIAGPR